MNAQTRFMSSFAMQRAATKLLFYGSNVVTKANKGCLCAEQESLQFQDYFIIRFYEKIENIYKNFLNKSFFIYFIQI